MTYLRFGVRDLLWATVVAGLAMGWWADHRNGLALQAEKDRKLHIALEHAKAHLTHANRLLGYKEESAAINKAIEDRGMRAEFYYRDDKAFCRIE